MTYMQVCDRCGTMVGAVDGGSECFTPIWVKNPAFIVAGRRDELANLHLCAACYSRFENEYLHNLAEYAREVDDERDR